MRCLAWMLMAGLSTAAAAQQFRGVNLGGWLVLESWITPSLYFSMDVPYGAGEWQFCEKIGQEAAEAALTSHWDTWVTFKELMTLANAGITHLRIPVGYWILGPPYLYSDEPYVTGGWYYLERALGWCKQLGLKAVIDLHGAPGSQNGHDNSGKSGGQILWNTDENKNRTVDVLRALANKIVAMNLEPVYEGVVDGIEMLNEPWTTVVGGPITLEELRSFYQEAGVAIRSTGFNGAIWFEDGWKLDWKGWEGFLASPQYHDFYMDTHIYKCFAGKVSNLTGWEQVQYTCKYDALRFSSHKADPIITGEWSMQLPHQYMPKYPYSPEDLEMLQVVALAQLQTYGVIGQGNTSAAGAFFWCHKIESKHSPWSYLSLLEDKVIPTDLGSASFDCSKYTNIRASN